MDRKINKLKDEMCKYDQLKTAKNLQLNIFMKKFGTRTFRNNT